MATLELFAPNQMWGAQPLDTVALEACDVAGGSITAGEYRAYLRAAGDVSIGLGLITMRANDRNKVEFIDAIQECTLKATFSGLERALGMKDYRLFPLTQRRAMGTRPLGGRVPHRVDESDHDKTVLSWDRVANGRYAIQVNGYEIYLVDVSSEGLDTTISKHFELGGRRPRFVYLEQRPRVQLGGIAGEVTWYDLSVVATAGEDIEDLALPISQSGKPLGRMIEFPAEDSWVVRGSYFDGKDNEAFYLRVDGQDTLVTDPPPRTLISWNTEELRIPMGWVAGVQFRLGGKALRSRDIQPYLSDGWVVGVGVYGTEADEVFLPSSPGQPGLGRWFVLPSARERVELSEIIR